MIEVRIPRELAFDFSSSYPGSRILTSSDPQDLILGTMWMHDNVQRMTKSLFGGWAVLPRGPFLAFPIYHAVFGPVEEIFT